MGTGEPLDNSGNEVTRLVPMLSCLCSWRRMRRAAHEALAKRAVQNYYPIQMKEATILASSLLSSSTGAKLEQQFHRVAASTICQLFTITRPSSR